jgi:hypothetical protein
VAFSRQEHPGHGQVRGRVAAGDVTEVDHAADAAAMDQDVGGVKVAVQPHWGPVPHRRHDCSLPHAHHGPAVDQAAQDAQVLGDGRAAVRERNAAAGVDGGVRRSGNVQGPQEPAQADRSVPQVSRRIPRGNLPGQEWDDTPRPRVARARLPDPRRRRNWQRQPRLKNWEPPLSPIARSASLCSGR